MNTRNPRSIAEQLMLLARFPPQSAARRVAPLRRNFFTTAQTRATPAPSRPAQSFSQCTTRQFRSTRLRSEKAKSDHVNPTPHLGSPEPTPSLSQRLKQLSREYGWTAVGVYLALSALDFPFCFLAVRWLGTDRIGHYEEVVKDAFWNAVRLVFPNVGPNKPHAKADVASGEAILAGEEGADVMQAASQAAASIWTQLGIAYLVHKSFIFIRVPLTAAILPKVVKTLRSWGYNIGKKKPKA